MNGYIRLLSVLIFVFCLLNVMGCPPQPPKEEVGGALVVEPYSIDFGESLESVPLFVWKNFSTSSVGPIIVEPQVPWINASGCTSPADQCYSTGSLDKRMIMLSVDREKTSFGDNSGSIVVRATNAPAITVSVTAKDLLDVDFSFSSATVGVKERVQFTNQTKIARGLIKKVDWDFGDGTTSSDSNPTHIYQKPGIYTVTLTVETSIGKETRRKSNCITVEGGNLIADFTASPLVADVNEEIQFVDRSTSEKESINKRLWDFGDGTTSNEVNPKHKYNAPGVYNVSLTVFTANQSATTKKEQYITVQRGVPPQARFSVAQIKPFIYIPVQFTDLSDPGSAPITEWIWNFGDGKTSKERNPMYAFSQIGPQTVTLTVKNKYGSSSSTQTVEVVYMPPLADFGADPLVVYAGSPVFFADLSRQGTEKIIRWVWDFGDGTTQTIDYQVNLHENGNTNYVYKKAGTYSVTLTVYTSTISNNTDKKTRTSYIKVLNPPIPKLVLQTKSPVINEEVVFLNKSEVDTDSKVVYEWYFGDTNTPKITTTLDPVSYIYTQSGIYEAYLKIKTETATYTSEKVLVHVDAPPIPDFDYQPKKISIEDLVQFTDLSQTNRTRPITGWNWSFGDGKVSNAQNPRYRYPAPGTYTVSFYLNFVHSHSGEELKTSTVTKTLRVDSAVPPVARFRVESPCAIVGSEVKFIDLSKAGTAPIAQWKWEFGDGGTSTQQSPVYRYSNPGTYSVTLTVKTAGGLESQYTLNNCVVVTTYNSPLDIFVRERDPEYSWTAPEVVDITRTIGDTQVRIARAYYSRMTSQRWRDESEIFSSPNPDEGSGILWKHWLTIVVPENLTMNTALLYIDGGNIRSDSRQNDEMRNFLGYISALTGSVVVHLNNVPRQPIVFMEDYDERDGILFERTEDAIISYTYDKYMNEYKAGNNDFHWPLLFPMAKSAVRAIDTTQTILSDILENRTPSQFIIAGASKRGWTTWLAGLTDCRIKGIAPLVIDVLNMDKQMEHHKKVYGYWAPAIYEYAQMKVFDRLVSSSTQQSTIPPEAIALLGLIDPYEYRERMGNIPKFIMNSSCDEFFLPDSARWYFDDLLGEKYLNYVPNVSHSLGGEFNLGVDSVKNLIAWYIAKSQDQELPKISWERVDANTVRLIVDRKFLSQVQEVYLWQCYNPDARDFRKYKLDEANLEYTKERLIFMQGVYEGKVSPPTSGWKAFFIQVTFNNPGRYQIPTQYMPYVDPLPPLVFTTPIFITPDVYPTFRSQRLDVNGYPLLILRGTPYEMGYDYAELMRDEILNHLNYLLNNLPSLGIDINNLNTVWQLQKDTPLIDPRLKEEIQGMSDSLGLYYDVLGALQLVELLNINPYTQASATSIWAGSTVLPRFWDKSRVLGTYSLNRSLFTPGQQDYPVVVFYIPEQGFPHVLFTFAGMSVARVGMNIAGIAYTDIPTDNDVINPNENLLSTFRTALYDVNRLRDLITLTTSSTASRPHKYLLMDGRYENRSAKLVIENTNNVRVVRDRDNSDEYYPQVLRYVLYDSTSSTIATTLLFDYIASNYGSINYNNLFVLSTRGAIVNRNMMNLVLDTTAFQGYVAYAAGTLDALTQAYRVINFQELLP